jgi:hypothetical protein
MPVISGGKVIEGALARGTDPLSDATAAFPYVTGALRVARVRYSFAVDGGAIGSINGAGATIIPSGAVVLATLLNVVTAVTSGGAATLAVGVEAAGDQQTGTAVSGAPWSTTGWKWATQTFTTAPDVTTAARDVVFTIATATVTAGVVDAYVFYLLPA